MKFHSIVTTIVLTTPLWHTVHASHIVSGSNSRLPMSLSSVINDLEAEGASRITTVAFLTSRGITRQKRRDLFHSLFAIGEGKDQKQGEKQVEDIFHNIDQTKTTAFGKKMGGEEDDTSDGEEEEEEVEGVTKASSVGIAVANPLDNASITEVASTVLACGGNIVFVASLEDLSRGEGLFDKLAPAMEKILNESSVTTVVSSSSSSTASSSSSSTTTTTMTNSINPLAAIAGAVLPESPKPPAPRTLIVVVEGALTEQDLFQAKSKFEKAATNALSSIVQNVKPRAYTLEQVFDNIEYVSSNGGPIDELIQDLSPILSCDPATAASNVAKAVFQDSNTSLTSGGTLHNSPLDLAAARKLLPLGRKAVEDCLSTVRARTMNSEDGTMMLVADFGSLCDASVKNAMDELDIQAGKTLLEKSHVGKRIRSELVEEMYSDLESQYEEQLKLLNLACFESFKRDLSQLRLSPNLDKDMEKVAQNAVQLFVSKAKGLRSTKSKAIFWPKGDAQASKLKRELKEYVTLRLQIARADGKYRPVPRKGVTVGMHWLLPKPFGNDYRLEPWDVHAKDDLIYVPKDKITDVRKDDVVTGDWRNSIVPAPTASEMIYLK